MNNVLTQIADRANQLKAADLDTVCTVLQDSIAGLRGEIKTKVEVLTAAGHESPTFGTLVAEVADLTQTVQVLVKAALDMNKLHTTATKTLDRVQKRLARYAKPAA